jgi:hypothetical protein
MADAKNSYQKKKNAEIAEIKDIIAKSGNTFHCKVANYFKDNGWTTLVSPYYLDGGTGKPREIDLIAEKCWPLGRSFRVREDYPRAIIIKLFIECKFITQPTVFWFSKKDSVAARTWLVGNTILREDNAFTEQHHYLSSNQFVAKLFAASKDKSIENEAMYKALNQCLNGTINLRRRPSISQNIKTKTISIAGKLEMPVILCDSFAKFYQVDMASTDNAQPMKENFQLEVNYAYSNTERSQRTEYFLIDVVEFKQLDSFLKVLESDQIALRSIIPQ